MSQRVHLSALRLITATVDSQDIVFAPEAAGLIGITYRGVVQSCARGKLPAFRLGRQWAMLRSDVMNYRRLYRRAPGQPERRLRDLPDLRTLQPAPVASSTVHDTIDYLDYEPDDTPAFD